MCVSATESESHYSTAIRNQENESYCPKELMNRYSPRRDAYEIVYERLVCVCMTIQPWTILRKKTNTTKERNKILFLLEFECSESTINYLIS